MRSLIRTKDGSVTVFDESARQAYHSQHGALSESEHVYIQNGLLHFIQTFPQRTIRILEVGFGTGLNCWLTAHIANERTVSVQYTGIENAPLEESIYSKLPYAIDPLFMHLQSCAWNQVHHMENRFSFEKINTDLRTFLSNYNGNKFNVIYFDAFSPNAVPHQWTLNVFQSLYNVMEAESILVTYCAKGTVKRTIRAAGFQLETLIGPPGKREMIRAGKMNMAE